MQGSPSTGRHGLSSAKPAPGTAHTDHPGVETRPSSGLLKKQAPKACSRKENIHSKTRHSVWNPGSCCYFRKKKKRENPQNIVHLCPYDTEAVCEDCHRDRHSSAKLSPKQSDTVNSEVTSSQNSQENWQKNEERQKHRGHWFRALPRSKLN